MNYILLLSFPNNACHHVKVWRNIIKQKPFEKMLPEFEIGALTSKMKFSINDFFSKCE